MRKPLLWLILDGLVYYAIEGIWHIPTNGGWANVLMLPVGRFVFLGALIVLIVEFVSGCILNIWLGMGIWDYSNIPFNILGQVCLLYGMLWILLMPFAIWLEDKLNVIYAAYKGKNAGNAMLYDYSLFEAYKELLRMKEGYNELG